MLVFSVMRERGSLEIYYNYRRGMQSILETIIASADTGIVYGRIHYSGSPGRGRVLIQLVPALTLLAQDV